TVAWRLVAVSSKTAVSAAAGTTPSRQLLGLLHAESLAPVQVAIERSVRSSSASRRGVTGATAGRRRENHDMSLYSLSVLKGRARLRDKGGGVGGASAAGPLAGA